MADGEICHMLRNKMRKIIFNGCIKHIGKDFPSYLEFAKEILLINGYDVEIIKETYFDTETGKNAKGSIIVDKDDAGMHYHILINGMLPDYENGKESPLISRPNEEDHITIIRHNCNIKIIN